MAELSAALASSGVDVSGIAEQLAALSAAVLAGFLSALVTIITTGMTSLVIVAFFLLESERFLNIVRTGVIKDRPMLSQLPAVGPARRRFRLGRHRLCQTRQEVGGCGPAVFGDPGQGGQLPGGRVSGLCLGPGPCPGRQGAVSAAGLDG